MNKFPIFIFCLCLIDFFFFLELCEVFSKVLQALLRRSAFLQFQGLFYILMDLVSVVDDQEIRRDLLLILPLDKFIKVVDVFSLQVGSFVVVTVNFVYLSFPQL